MAKREQHRVSEGQDARSERPAMGMGSPEPGANREHPQVDNLCYRELTQVDNLCYRELTQVGNLCYEGTHTG